MTLVGNRERERAASELRRHYVRGRLSVDELDQRVSIAVSARSRRELGQALRDLPAAWRDAEELVPAATAAARRAGRVVVVLGVTALWALGTLALVLSLAVAALVTSVAGSTVAVIALVWAVLTYALFRVARRLF